MSLHGRMDILVNSIGFRGAMVQVHEIIEEEWDAVLYVNPKATLLCCKAALKVMIEQKARQHRQHLRHRGTRGHGAARLPMRRQVGTSWPDPDQRQ